MWKKTRSTSKTSPFDHPAFTHITGHRPVADRATLPAGPGPALRLGCEPGGKLDSLPYCCIIARSDPATGGSISYELGGWSTPWGIEYRVDTVNAFVLLIVTAISSAVLLFAQRSVAREILSTRIPLFYTTYMLCLAGLLGITVTGDVFNLFVFMEISALSSYTLIALSEQRRALTAAYQYLFMGTIGATFILIGIGLLYMMTGTLNMQDLSRLLPAVTVPAR